MGAATTKAEDRPMLYAGLTPEQRMILEQRLAALRAPRNPGNPLEWVSGKRLGPNDKCPCGSGKKHKKCCGRFG